MANKDKIETSSFKFQLQRSSTSPLREYERMTANMVWYTFVSKKGTCSVRTIFRSFRFEFCTLVLRPNSMVGNLLFCTTSVDALHTWCCSHAKWWKNVYLFLRLEMKHHHVIRVKQFFFHLFHIWSINLIIGMSGLFKQL